MKKIICLILFAIMPIIAQSATNKGSLKVIVKGLRNSNGWVVCHIFNSSDGYPLKSKKALKYIDSYNIKDGQTEIIFYDLPYGDYAFTVHHDENGNKKMDTNFFGLPTEGWACSRNAKGFIGVGPPSFDDAKFSINSNYTEQVVTMNY